MITMAVIIGILVALALYFIAIYNALVQLRVACENAWSQIDVQLKRRYDLIPNLIETVKGYTKHEQETLEKVIQARNTAIAVPSGDVAAQAAAEQGLSGALRQIFALSERYPDLKANQNFAQLQEEITSTENKISFARQHYNDTAAEYNTNIQQVPNNIVAGIGGFKNREFFELDSDEAQAAKKAPKVEF